MYSTPVVVGAPRERYDVLYGDTSYTAFFTQYKNRRQVAYLGANDGMMHAFNVGFYHEGRRHSWNSHEDRTRMVYQYRHGGRARRESSGMNSGGFIPQELLPHLRWLADPAYTHVYYVDLKPKDDRCAHFPGDADHPGGWGTILIGGFRMGGSCGNCTSQGDANDLRRPISITMAGVDAARTFLSAYFVLDITNPEKVPTLLWSYSDTNLGFTMSYPSSGPCESIG